MKNTGDITMCGRPQWQEMLQLEAATPASYSHKLPGSSHSFCVFHMFQKILFKSKYCDSGSIILQVQVLLCNQFILHHPESFDVFLAYILRAPEIRKY